MKNPKSTILKKILLNLNLAHFSNENPEISVDKLVEFRNADAVSRRKFVGDISKLGLLTGIIGASALQSCKKADTINNKKLFNDLFPVGSNKKIVIIGAGMAGLNAAYQLNKKGVLAEVYEGSFRIGGRILTHYNDALQMGIHPEFGGDFIDSGHVDMLDLAKEFELDVEDLLTESRENNLIHETFFFEGRHIPEEELITEFKKIVPTLQKDKESLGEDYDTEQALVFDKMSLETYINSLVCKPWIKEMLTAAYLAEFGLATREQSAINLLDMIATDTSAGFKVFGDSDERFKIKQGNSKLIEKLAEKLPNQIFKESILTSISNQSGKYKLTFKDKPDVDADIVLMTIPFTMLRNVKMDIKEMTPEKQVSIDNLGYGQNNKLFLGFNNRPWREGKNKFNGYLFHKDIHDGWDSSSIKSIESNKGVYTCFFGGDESIRLAGVAINNPYAPANHIWKTDLPEAEVNKYLNEIEQVFSGSKQSYNKKHVFASWSSYPFTKSSYTCPKVGQWNTAMLHTATPIGNLYFAGEHCSVDFQGYMNGAAETGRLAAENIFKKVMEMA